MVVHYFLVFDMHLLQTGMCFDDRQIDKRQHILLEAFGEKKGVLTIKQGALSYWTKTRNTIMELDRTAQQGAGKRPLLDPGCVEVSLQWATGSAPYNKTTAAPSVHTQTLHICCTLPPYPAL